MSERVTIRTDRKEQWQSAVEDNPKYESLTHLIELAVHRELHGMYSEEEGDSTSVTYSPEVTNQELRRRMKDMEDELEDIGEDVTAIKKEEEATTVTSTRDVFGALPESPTDAVTPEQLADGMEFTTVEQVEEILSNLRRQTGRVNITTIDGEAHYFKQV